MAERALAAPARKMAGPILLLLIVIAFFWKILLTSQYNWLESPDLAFQVVPWLNYESQQFHMRRIPIWDPFVYGGQSLIGQGQPGLAFPLNWLLFSLPLENGQISFLALNWYYALIHYLAALFCYLLCRDLGRSVVASVLGGVAFGLSGYIGNTDWPQMINGAIWGPLVLLFLLRAGRGIRPISNAAFSGLFLGMSWLSGHHQIPIFLTLAAIGIWVYLRRLVLPAAVFLAFFIFTGALQMWPAYSYGHSAVRWAGVDTPLAWDQAVPYLVDLRYSLNAIGLLGLLIPGFNSGADTYVGIVGLTLGGLALVRFRRSKELGIFCALGLAGLFLALARNDVFHGILYSVVPMFEKARSPASAIYLFHFAIAVLLAFGLDALRSPETKPFLRRLTWILVGFGALTYFVLIGAVLGRALSWPADDRVMMSALAAFALAGLLYRWTRAQRTLGWALVLIIGLYVVEIGNVSLFALPHEEQKERNIYLSHYAESKSIAEFLRRERWPLRVMANPDDVPFNFGDWYGIDTQMGYVASLTANVSLLEMHTPRAKMLYGVGYEISRKPTMDGQQEVFRGDNGLIVFKNPKALPRVWIVHEAVQVKNLKEARARLQDEAIDLEKKTFGYDAPPALETCDGDVVFGFRRGINSTTAMVYMKCRGMVIQSENMAPGWAALVDGKPAPIYEAYTTLRGVVVGPGRHLIEMRYKPLSVTAGAIATFAAFLAALALCFTSRGAGAASERAS